MLVVMDREQYTPHVLYILPTGTGYTAYISSKKKLHGAVSLTRFLPQKKRYVLLTLVYDT